MEPSERRLAARLSLLGRFEEDGPAARAGVVAGDQLISINGGPSGGLAVCGLWMQHTKLVKDCEFGLSARGSSTLVSTVLS